MGKRNKYNLSSANESATDGIIVNVVVKYDIDADRVEIEFGRRKDAEDDSLMLRLAQQVEGALRQVIPSYDEELRFLEIAAGLIADEDDDELGDCACDCKHG